MKLRSSYRALRSALSRYWTDYGGWADFLRSPLLHLSLLLAAASYSVWLEPHWMDLPLALLPNLLGFSLGSYALIFSLADDRLLAALNSPTTDGSPTNLRVINATFLHFILMQTIAILFAIANKSTLVIDLTGLVFVDRAQAQLAESILSALAGATGYFLTVYSVVLLIGAALAAYRLAVMSGRAAQLAQRKPVPAPSAPAASGANHST